MPSLRFVTHRALSSRPQHATNVTTKAFEDLPAIPGGLPLVGNMYQLMSGPMGAQRFADNFIRVGREHDREGIGMVRVKSNIMNPGKGEGRGVLVYDADVIEQVFR